MKKLYKFQWDCGRQGSVEALFVEEEETVRAAVGKTIEFGEVLGKHSDVHGTLEEADLEMVTDDQDFLLKLVQVIGKFTVSGHNPLSYMEE